MPIEIRELLIKASVTAEEGGRRKGRKGQVDQDTLVQQCVDQVMEILKEKSER